MTQKKETELKNLIKEAGKTYSENFGPEVYFERAVFLSWYCALGDCKFCYMSLNKEKKDPKKARRSFASILAEAIICKEMGWKIEFISGGYESYSFDEIKFLIKAIYSIMGEKQWLNIGTLSKKDIKSVKEYVIGYAGTVETVNWKIREEVCPSKKLLPIIKVFEICSELGLKKAITIIIGLGETIDDFDNLTEFINKHDISRITFYTLNPHEGTMFHEAPSKEYVAKWIAKTRINFPKIEIIAGAWIDKIDYYPLFLKAGANSITKLPLIKKFSSDNIKNMEKEIKKTGRKLIGSFSGAHNIDSTKAVAYLDENIFSEQLKEEIKVKLDSYLKQMKG